MTLSPILKKIQTEIIDSGQDQRYKIGAYDFVLKGLEFYLTKIGEKRHVRGQELAIGLLEFAYKQFGTLAQSVFLKWGVTTTDDFGYIVYNLIGIGIMSKQPDDAIDDFFNLVDFNSYFSNQDYYIIDKEAIKKIKGA